MMNRQNTRRLFLAALLTLSALGLSSFAETPTSSTIPIKTGDKLAFLGDSITQGGWSEPGGYVRLVVAGLAANDIKVEPIPAGISGHKSNDMLNRLAHDVLNKKPTWVTISCGVNDVWHAERGVPLAQYKKNMTAIVDQAQQAGIKVMILTATMITEDPNTDFNKKLDTYNDFLRTLAKEKKCLLADLSQDMHTQLKEKSPGRPSPGNRFTSDGVHMKLAGNMMMARGVLKAFELSDEQLKKAELAWQQLPNLGSVNLTVNLTLAEKEVLAAEAAAKHLSVEEMLQNQFNQEVQQKLAATTAPSTH